MHQKMWPLPTIPKSAEVMVRPPTLALTVLSALKQWRNSLVDKGVPGVRLLNNTQMRSVARHEPRTVEDFQSLDSILLAKAILAKS